MGVVYLISRVLPFVTLWTVACQVSLSMEFPRQEYWSGLPFPSLGDLPYPGVEPMSPTLVGKFFTTEPPGKCKIDQKSQRNSKEKTGWSVVISFAIIF